MELERKEETKQKYEGKTIETPLKRSEITELQKRDVLRLSNEEANRITKECIYTALLILMNEKEFDKISITELVKRSGVSRTAFYRNFHTKEDVLKDTAERIFHAIDTSFGKEQYRNDAYSWYYDLFEHIKREQVGFGLLLKAGMQKKEFFELNTYVAVCYADLDSIKRYSVLAWWGALQNILLEWYRNGMKEETTQMANLCCELLDDVAVMLWN